MSTEIAKEQKVIYMKSGLPIFVDADRVAALEKILETNTGHRFVKMDDRTINTAEIEGIYTTARYGELIKIKEGMRLCEYGTWHTKRDDCQCKKERWKAHQEDMRRIAAKRDQKVLTPEEQARVSDHATYVSEEAAMNGSELFRGPFLKGSRSGKKIRRSSVKRFEKEGKKADIEGLAIDESK